MSQFPAAWKIRENSRLQPGPWAWWTRSSLATASEQSGHWLNLDLFSHSPSRCSVRLAISTTCEHNAKLYSINLVMQYRYFQQLDLTLWLQLYNRSENLVRKINKKLAVYLSTFVATPQHRTMFPVVKVQSVFCKRLVFFTAEYTQATTECKVRGSKGTKVYQRTITEHNMKDKWIPRLEKAVNTH